MQTATGDPLRLKFTPEQIAQFERRGLPLGMNNSGGDKYRKEGVQAQQYQEQEKKRKEEKIKSRMEMRPVIKRKATFAEKLQGKKDEYEQIPQVIGMSGADPLLSFYVGGVGLNGIGTLAKTGLWNVAKYAPTTQLGNWGRGYFVGNAFKNSFNGTAPILTSQTTSLLYQPTKQNESGLTSLKFFERKPSRISEAERLGVPKGERNQSNIISKFGEPFTYDENGLFIPNSNYNFRNGWGLIEDAIKTRRIRVPEGDYKPAVLKKYPFLNKSVGSFSTVRDLSFNFPYFQRGESIWPFKTQVQAEDLIAIPNDLPNVSWNKVSKFNTIFENEIANIGDKTTPIINGKSNIFPSDKALFFRLNKSTNKYEPYEIIPTSEGWGVYSNKYNNGFSTTYFKYPNYTDEPINIKKNKQGGKMNILEFLKNGSGIHIKKKNRGKFTDYCGGKVTDSCIRRAKASGNPTLVKRATFAANARKWKHYFGGKIKISGV